MLLAEFPELLGVFFSFLGAFTAGEHQSDDRHDVEGMQHVVAKPLFHLNDLIIAIGGEHPFEDDDLLLVSSDDVVDGDGLILSSDEIHVEGLGDIVDRLHERKRSKGEDVVDIEGMFRKLEFAFP